MKKLFKIFSILALTALLFSCADGLDFRNGEMYEKSAGSRTLVEESAQNTTINVHVLYAPGDSLVAWSWAKYSSGDTNYKCDVWNKIPDENYGFSLYGTPEESTTFKFAKRLMSHKILPGVNDKNYIMNSYHMDIREGLDDGVDAFTKLSTESEFQKYTNGGAVSYVETSHMENNIDAILAIIKHIYDNILYAEINSKFDNCHKCGYNGEIDLIDNGKGHLIWKCPNCGNTDTREMTIIRRICGYCGGANDMNEGRKGDLKGRALNV